MGKLVDVDSALAELGLQMEDYNELVQELKKVIDKIVPELEAAAESGNKQTFKELSHSLKGALRNLRFYASGTIAENLEKIDTDASKETLQQGILELKTSVADSFEELHSN